MEREDTRSCDQGVSVLKYESSVSVGKLVDSVRESLEISDLPDDDVYYDILNEFLAQLYSGVINDIRRVRIVATDGERFALPSQCQGYEAVRSCDVRKVCAGGYEYERVGREYCIECLTDTEHMYTFSEDGEIMLLSSDRCDSIDVCFAAVPLKYSKDDIERKVCVPDEFVSMCEAKLRCELYRLCGEDALCTSWAQEYNSLLAGFRIWLEVTEG